MAGATEAVLTHLKCTPATLSELAIHCQSRTAARQIVYRLRNAGYSIELRPSGSARVDARYHLTGLPRSLKPYVYPDPAQISG